MPKIKLFNLKNLGSWAGIKKKRKENNGRDLEAEAADKENVEPEEQPEKPRGGRFMFPPSTEQAEKAFDDLTNIFTCRASGSIAQQTTLSSMLHIQKSWSS
jgi:hypothetical protein